jgi:hypothetical protein
MPNRYLPLRVSFIQSILSVSVCLPTKTAILGFCHGFYHRAARESFHMLSPPVPVISEFVTAGLLVDIHRMGRVVGD